MLFNSYVFIFLFLPLSFAFYFIFAKKHPVAAKSFLVAASLYFYSYFKLEYLPVIVSSVLFNYFIGYFQLRHTKGTVARLLLTAGVIFNVGILGYFKYLAFATEVLNDIFGTDFAIVRLLLPLGISFYTFQQLSYLVDNYRGKNPRYSFVDYALYVTFFPQLIAGPIVFPGELLPQFEERSKWSLNYENMSCGLFLFSCGLAKKCLIADTVSVYANFGFDSMTTLNFSEAWIVVLAYGIQLYFDFSGYCDMALGLGKLFNIELPLNFNSPYKAADFQDFWRRWHITLGRFMMNYLYIPLGGNRKGPARTYMNLVIVFVVSGIWHGAGWTFLLWGMFHGICIMIHRIWKEHFCGRFGIPAAGMPHWLGIAITFVTVNVFWVFFRADSLARALKILRSMFSVHRFRWLSNEFKVAAFDGVFSYYQIGIVLFFAVALALLAPNTVQIMEKIKHNNRNLGVATVVLFILGLLFVSRTVSFLYFNF